LLAAVSNAGARLATFLDESTGTLRAHRLYDTFSAQAARLVVSLSLALSAVIVLAVLRTILERGRPAPPPGY